MMDTNVLNDVSCDCNKCKAVDDLNNLLSYKRKLFSFIIESLEVIKTNLDDNNTFAELLGQDFITRGKSVHHLCLNCTDCDDINIEKFVESSVDLTLPVKINEAEYWVVCESLSNFYNVITILHKNIVLMHVLHENNTQDNRTLCESLDQIQTFNYSLQTQALQSLMSYKELTRKVN